MAGQRSRYHPWYDVSLRRHSQDARKRTRKHKDIVYKDWSVPLDVQSARSEILNGQSIVGSYGVSYGGTCLIDDSVCVLSDRSVFDWIGFTFCGKSDIRGCEVLKG